MKKECNSSFDEEQDVIYSNIILSYQGMLKNI